MTTNLEKRSFEADIKKLNERLECNIDVLEMKFNDAIKRIENVKSSIEESIRDTDVENRATDTINKIDSKTIINDSIRDFFLQSNATVDDVNHLVSKYQDNRITLFNAAANIGTDNLFLDDDTELHTGRFSSTKMVKNSSFSSLTGVNAIDNDELNMAMGFVSTPGHNRSLYINIFDSIPILNKIDSVKQQPFTNGYNPVRSLDNKPGQSVPFIVIERINKVHSFDFGIRYMTKRDTIKLYIIKNGVPVILETGINANSSAYIKNFYGSFILEDLGDSINSSVIINNSEESIFDGSLPEFTFRLSFDDKFIFLYLENVKPNRIAYSAIESLSPDFYQTENELSQVFIRDIMEMVVNETKNTDNSDDILSIKNKYGVSKGLLGENVSEITESILNILTPFRSEIEDIQNIYIIPNYMVNLSLKDNSFHVRDSFIVGQMNQGNDILDLPYSLMEIIPKGESQVQLNGIRLTDGNNIPLISDQSTNIYSNVNTIFDMEVGKFVKKSSISTIVSENSEFIKDHIIDNNEVFYVSRVLLTTSLNDGLTVDTENVPDYIIDEVGKCVKGGDEYRFYCKYYITYNKTNESIQITNDKELREFITKTPLPFVSLSGIVSDIPQYEVNNNELAIDGSNFDGIPYRNALPIIFNPIFGLNIDDRNIKALFRVNTKILPHEYDYEGVVIKHATITDPQYIYGLVPKTFFIRESVPNQAVLVAKTPNFQTITVEEYENCSVYPGSITVVTGSNVEYSIIPEKGFSINRVLVNDEVVQMNGNRLVLKNINEDINISIETIVRIIPTYTITIVNSSNCGTILPTSDQRIVEEGLNVTYKVTPNIGYYLSSVLINGVPIGYIKPDNSFEIKNIRNNIDLSIICTEEPKEKYTFNILNSDNCSISPSFGDYTVYEDDNYEINVTPNVGYRIKRFIIDDVVYNNLGIPVDPVGETDVIFSGNRVTIPVTKSHFFKVELEEIPPVIYFINTNCTNGVISPSSNNPLGVSVIENEDILFTITPNNGYTIGTISINGDIVTEIDNIPGIIISGNTVQFNSVQSDGIIDVKCIKIVIMHNITIDIPEGSNFTIENELGNSDSLEYEQNSTPVFNIIPNSGYSVTHVIINGVEIPVNSSIFIFNPLIEDKIISAIVEITPVQEYSVTVIRMYKCIVLVSPFNTVESGSNITIDIFPDLGYTLDNLKINGILQEDNPLSIEINSIDKDYSIYATCKPIFKHILPIDGDNYKLFPDILTPVKYGDNQVYEILPDEGYIRDSVIIGTNGVEESPIPSNRFYLFSNVIEDHSIRATVIKKSFTVTPLHKQGFNVDPVNSEIVYYNDNSAEYTFSPYNGKYIKKILVDNEEVYINNTIMYEPLQNETSDYSVKYLIENVKSNHIITAEVADLLFRSFIISVDYNSEHCVITPSSSIVAGMGSGHTINIIVNSGFRIAQVRVNGNIRDLSDNDSSYVESFSNITNDIYITVVTEVRPPIIHNINIGPNTFCSVSCIDSDLSLNPGGVNSSSILVIQGGTLTFRATPLNYLYKLVKFVINNSQDILTDGGYGQKQLVLENITDNMNLSAVAEPIRHKITLAGIENCTVNNFDGVGSFIEVGHLTNVTITVNPILDYELSEVLINGIKVNSTNSNNYTISQVSENLTLTVICIPKLYITVHTGINCRYNVYLSGNTLKLNGSSGLWRMIRGTNYFKVVTVPDIGYKVDRSWISHPTVVDIDTGLIKWKQVTTSPNEMIFNDMRENIGWYSECKKMEFNIVVVQPIQGEITYNDELYSNLVVEYGDSRTFQITPNPGYIIAEIRINGSVIPFNEQLTAAGGFYTFNNITGNRSITCTIIPE